jgi:xylan 1,4-beta-xylosidase
MLDPTRRSARPLAFWLLAAAVLGCACLIPPKPAAKGASSEGAASAVDAPSTTAPKTCADPAAPTSARTDPQRCADPPPWTSGGTNEVTIDVDAGARGRPWNRFYERAVAADHAGTVLCTAWGRNVQNALRKGHDQAGFQYVRFHGVLDDDIGVYSEDAAGKAVYRWSRFDHVYDAVVGAGMRPIVELSFTPSALASKATKVLSLLWYNGASPNISPPRDWSRWRDFMSDIVRHLEQRYGPDEVRDHWYFEVWNEPSWMYSLGDAGYTELYENTVTGLMQGDPGVKVGGPAGSSGESPFLVPALIAAAKAKNLKLDFITYHRYGDDKGTLADANGMQDFHRNLMGILQDNHFTGELINDEFGPSSKADVCRDNESAASFIAKTIHLIGTDVGVAPPAALGYWTLSDLYEEFNTGEALAYREGNYGLLLKGDPHIAASLDVAKPAFNAFRLLHRMGDIQIGVGGGTTGDGVNAAATVSTDGSSVQVLVYNHIAGARADATRATSVSLTVQNLAFPADVARVRHYVVDRSHANSYTAWTSMGKPAKPTADQWDRLRRASELCFYERTVPLRQNSFRMDFPQSVYSVALIELSAERPPSGGPRKPTTASAARHE